MSKKFHEGEQGVIPSCKSSLMISIGDVWPVDRLLLRFGQIYTPQDEERSECFCMATAELASAPSSVPLFLAPCWTAACRLLHTRQAQGDLHRSPHQV